MQPSRLRNLEAAASIRAVASDVFCLFFRAEFSGCSSFSVNEAFMIY